MSEHDQTPMSSDAERVEAAARAAYEFDERVSQMFHPRAAGPGFDQLPEWAKGTHRDRARTVIAEWERSRPVSGDEVAAGAKSFAIDMHGDSADQQDVDYYAPMVRNALEAAAKVRAQGGNHE